MSHGNILYTPRGGRTTAGSNAPGAFLVRNGTGAKSNHYGRSFFNWNTVKGQNVFIIRILLEIVAKKN